jgi:galactose-1-phosphate uridylyltransferase
MALKHNKSSYKNQNVSEPFQLTPNRFNLLQNDVMDDDKNEDTLTKTGSLSELATHRVIKFKRDHKQQKVRNKIHKVIIVGDSMLEDAHRK